MSVLLTTLTALAAKAKEAPPEPSSLELVRDTFLFQGPYGNALFWFAISGFCLANAKAILSADKSINFFHGLALQLMTAYGGSTICALMCGKPVVFFVNEALAPVALTTFTVLYAARAPFVSAMNSMPGAVLISIAWETMRCHVLMNCAAMAASTLSAFVSGAYPVPVAAPLVCGVIGGCGGAFLPADKGLKPLEKGLNWRTASAIISSLFLQLAMRDPNTKGYFVSLAPALEAQSWCRFSVIAFCVLVGTYSVITGATPFGANPLVPPAQGKAKKA